MITIKENNYELRYTEKRVEQIEAAMDKPLMAELSKTSGMLKLMDLKIVLGFGLVKAETLTHLPPKQGLELAEAYIQEAGYAPAVQEAVATLQNDLPFFFPEG